MTQVEGRKEIKTSYRPYLIQGLICVAVLVFGVFGWGYFAKINGAVIASGVIVVEGKSKTLQHLDGGIVGEILVKNGDKVNEGDVVIRLNPTAMDANRTIVEKRLYVNMARAAQLKSARDNRRKIDWPAELIAVKDKEGVGSAMSGQQKLFQARRNSLFEQLGQLTERVGQSEEQISGYRDLIQSKNKQLELTEEQLATYRKYEIKGAVSKNQIIAVEREKARLQGEIASHRSDIARTQIGISEIKIQMSQLKRDNEAAVLTELAQVNSEINDLREQLTTASDQLKRIDIVSPVSGTVHDLLVTTIGGVISPGQPIMQIIPEDDRLVIEAKVLPNDIDQVYIGQPAVIMMSAFNARTTAELNGTVLDASADSLVDQTTGIAYFNVRLQVSEEEMKKLNGLTLIPGMPAEAFLQTESRSALSYLLKPATDYTRRAFRED